MALSKLLFVMALFLAFGATQGQSDQQGHSDQPFGYGQCRILSAAFEDYHQQKLDGYGYKPEPTLEYSIDRERTRPQPGECQLQVYSHSVVNRSFLLAAERPLIIRGATNSWPARDKWNPTGIAKFYNDTVFQACPTFVKALGSLIADGKYHTGQMGMRHDCYAAHGKPTQNGPDWKMLKDYDRQYSPFMATASDDYVIPTYFLPARLLYMGVGYGRGGVQPEEHPSAWFAAVTGRKRWLFHPPNMDSPSAGANFIIHGSDSKICEVDSLFTSTLTCDQKEGDIVWIPNGWWHSTCNLDEFSMGIGGVTYRQVEEQAFADRVRHKCGLGSNAKHNSILRNITREHSLEEIPYCKEHKCPVVPYPLLPSNKARQSEG
jgi:hypothetical protein